ncbi:Smr domain containing protein [Leishmania donovani]|uniref:Smr domain-containing protein n=1 Tax=Leishmania donovani TaxID=5661 RepID=A0A504X8I5_LEIDO|nr:hypothetical protein CGC20_2735 [Leishmania donovani]CAJ1991490.1 Smr domain containing protein [Leishmania donovani]VDZ47330.1 KH_domain/Domain_of_unknown_function_(DUF1771)/Smr_domain_containing_protein_putative/Pfam:PF00013/Pfam:PF13014/Pfam:PF08590/Pfam:PF01713 [Leishmania donovani]
MPEKCIGITTVQVGHVVGRGGSTLKGIQERTGATLCIVEDGPQVKITADDAAKVAAAEAEVQKIVANQQKPDYEGPCGARLRKEADELGQKRSKLFEEATKMREAGDHEGANKLVAMAKKAGEDMKARHREAALAIAKHNNEEKGKGQNYFDMHGLHLEEAIEMLKVRMDKLEEKPVGSTTEFEVIPGAGHHSAPGTQKLRRATLEYVQLKGYPYEEVNAGAFLVKVPGLSGGVLSKPEDGDKAPTKPKESATGVANKPKALASAATSKSKGQSCCACM